MFLHQQNTMMKVELLMLLGKKAGLALIHPEVDIRNLEQTTSGCLIVNSAFFPN
jgi:hypothetical protein